jgi:hypothetical protein
VFHPSNVFQGSDVALSADGNTAIDVRAGPVEAGDNQAGLLEALKVGNNDRGREFKVVGGTADVRAHRR